MSDRNDLIDYLRGASILIVISVHGALLALPGNFLAAGTQIISNGYYGVAIFFVISGFLITRNTLRRYGEPNGIDFGQFYAMRAARIMPPLLLFIIVMSVMFVARNADFHPSDPKLFYSGLYSALTFQYHKFPGGNQPGMYAWAPLWSLSIEEIFYFVFPAACFFARRRSIFIALLAALICYGPFARQSEGLLSFWSCADLLALGSIAALLENRFVKIAGRAGSWWVMALSLAGLTAIVLCTKANAQSLLDGTVLGISVAGYLLSSSALASVKIPPVVAAPLDILRRFGLASYEIYLFHVGMILLYRNAVPRLATAFNATPQSAIFGVLCTLAFLTCVLGLGTLISRYFSEPVRRKILDIYSPRLRAVSKAAEAMSLADVAPIRPVRSVATAR